MHVYAMYCIAFHIEKFVWIPMIFDIVLQAVHIFTNKNVDFLIIYSVLEMSYETFNINPGSGVAQC